MACVGEACGALHDAVYGPAAARLLCGGGGGGFQKKDDPQCAALHLHALLPMGAVHTYVRGFKRARVEIEPFPGLRFSSAAEAEAAGVTWLELSELADESTVGAASSVYAASRVQL